jgi:predicted Zn-dependent protease
MTPTDFRTTADVAEPALAHGSGCRCALHARRRLGGALIGSGALAALGASAPAAAQDAECKVSAFTRIVSADQIEQAAGQQYVQMLQQAQQQRALAPADNAQLQRLRYIARRIIPFTTGCNPRAQQWRWDVNLIGSQELNAFCMPGGKIAFYFGILAKLKLDDDEVATIMGHEVAHALLEHARERMAKTMATRGAIELGAALFGLGGAGQTLAGMGGQLLSLSFSRSDESEADALGLVLSAKAGYKPSAGVTLWHKMAAASKGAPPQWMSTHPSSDTRIRDIESRLARVDPVYEQAAKPDRRFAPPVA